MQAVEAVLFDFGMVLSGPPVPAVWAEMQRISGLDEATLHRLYWQYRDDYDRGSLDGVPYWERIAADGGKPLTAAQRDQLLALDVDLWTDMNEPMLAWIRQLHAAGIRTGILSNMGDRMATGILEKLDWMGHFHHTVWSHALKMRKPERAIYAAAAEGLGVAPERILFLDDKEENIRAAEQFGMQGILYRDFDDFQTEMEHRGYNYLLQAEKAGTTH